VRRALKGSSRLGFADLVFNVAWLVYAVRGEQKPFCLSLTFGNRGGGWLEIVFGIGYGEFGISEGLLLDR